MSCTLQSSEPKHIHSEDDLKKVMNALTKKLDIRDRTHWFHKYNSCFRGKDFVDLILEQSIVENRQDGVHFATNLLRSGMLSSVRGHERARERHGERFYDDHTYYRLADNDRGLKREFSFHTAVVGEYSIETDESIAQKHA